jgi:hypothetical protein
MASVNPRLLQALVKALKHKELGDRAGRSQADENAAYLNSIKSKPRTVDQQIDEPDEAVNAFVGKLKEGARSQVPADASTSGANITNRPGKIRYDTVDDYAETKAPEAVNTGPVEDNRILSVDQRKAIEEQEIENSTQDAIMRQARISADSKPLRADEVVNPNRQKAAELDLEGLHIREQMDVIQDIIDSDPGLSALSPQLLKETMPDIIKNNRSILGIKNDVTQEATSVFDKLNDLAKSVAIDPTLSKKIQVMRAQASQASDRGDHKTLQLMLEQLTGTDAGLEGLERFGKGRPTVPNDPTSLPINVQRPTGEPTASLEQIMKAVTQELGIK